MKATYLELAAYLAHPERMEIICEDWIEEQKRNDKRTFFIKHYPDSQIMLGLQSENGEIVWSNLVLNGGPAVGGVCVRIRKGFETMTCLQGLYSFASGARTADGH